MTASLDPDQQLRTLILTPWMDVHRVVGWQKAIVHAVTGEADTLEVYDAVCASPSVSLQIPAVMRLSKSMSVNKSKPKFSRPNVYARDGYRCCYDGKRHPIHELNYDHVLPRSRGGKTVWGNIVTSCIRCNLRKGHKTPAEAGFRMHFKPYVPTSLPMAPALVSVGPRTPSQWLPYLRAPMQQTA